MAVMEKLDAMTLKEIMDNGMPGMKSDFLDPMNGRGTEERERFLTTLMKSMARQVALVMNDTTNRNYMARYDGEALRVDFADFSFQKPENLVDLDLNLENTILGAGSNAKESALMKEAFTSEWARLQQAFAQNREGIRKEYVNNIWNWKAQHQAQQNFGWEVSTNLGEFMFKNLEKNLSYTPEQAWGMFVEGKGLVK